MSFVMPTYFNRLPVAFERGEGAWLWDTEGNKYLDALAGIAVCSLGHAHPAITKTICYQAGQVIHTSNNYQIPQQEKLAEKLCTVANMGQAYFCNSGAEANEAAIKLTRLYAKKKSITNPVVITMKNSFHGRTMATLCASGTERIQIGFEPLLPGFIYVDYNDIAAVEEIVAENSDVVAIMLEPILGDGGVRIADIKYLQQLRALCDKNDYLLIFDEVQTGVGRTGKWFAHQYAEIAPDIMTVAKALGNGFPIAACLASGKAMNLFGPGKHGTTYGGNPLGCAIGAEVLRVMEEDNVLQNAQEVGAYLVEQLKENLSQFPEVKEVRGKGLMIGVELDRSCLDIVKLALEHRLLTNVVANNVIRLLPPLVLTKLEADELVKRLKATLQLFLQTV